MLTPEAAIPCSDCSLVKSSLSGESDGKMDTMLRPDGGISYAEASLQYAGGFSFTSGDLSPRAVAEIKPDFPDRLRGCPGPQTRLEKAPRRGLFGVFGLKREVEVRYCGATTDDELVEIAKTPISYGNNREVTNVNSREGIL